MNKSQTVSVGTFFVLGIALIWTVKQQLGERAVENTQGYEVVGSFDTLLQLRTGDDVRMAGVRIGSVQYTGLINKTPTAVFKIDPNFQIPSDSVATIGMAGLLGNNMVSIEMGVSPSSIQPKGKIRTSTGYDINHIFNEIGSLSQQIGGSLENFEKILGNGDGEKGVFQTLNQILRENEVSLKNTISNLDTITSHLSSGEGTFGRLLMDDELYVDLKKITTELDAVLSEGEGLIADTRSVVNHVKEGKGTLGELVYGETNLTSEVQLLIKDLRQFSAKLNNPNSTVGKLLVDDQMYGELQGLMRKANQALDGFGDSAPISAIGAVATPLF